MSDDRNSGTRLEHISESIQGMAASDRDEMAGFGLIVDWEIVKFFRRADWHLLSLSFRWKVDEVLMVVKFKAGETQYVAFVSRESPIYCMRTLVRKLRENTLAMYPDKYA